jgi:CATRA-associated small protein
MDRLDEWDAETVGDALDVLQDLVLWELAPQRWAQVEQILDRIAQALGARDAEDLRDAIADLELSGPVRVLRIGSAGVGGIPEPVLDRRNSLVHALSQEQPAGPAPAPEGDRGGRPAR